MYLLILYLSFDCTLQIDFYKMTLTLEIFFKQLLFRDHLRTSIEDLRNSLANNPPFKHFLKSSSFSERLFFNFLAESDFSFSHLEFFSMVERFPNPDIALKCDKDPLF